VAHSNHQKIFIPSALDLNFAVDSLLDLNFIFIGHKISIVSF
jgi:hypothetical protein